jgi:phosphoenolpyruvate---glycerone phosphotransferase subunit DhaL
MATDLVGRLIDAAVAAICADAERLTSLDRAIGDGDHGVNMRRGFEALAAARDELAGLPLGPALQKAGMALVMKVGGASGPLYGSLLIAIGKAAPEAPGDGAAIARAFADGVAAVRKRGRSETGQKTMLDVLVPALRALEAGSAEALAPRALLDRVRAAAEEGLASTGPMQATAGRASYLGARSVGHLDPGAASSALLIGAVCDVLAGEV